MRRKARTVYSIICFVVGAVLISLAFAGKVDSYWNGVGSGLFVVSILNLLRIRRVAKDPEYRENMEIEEKDERNVFLRDKAWAWTGYSFLMIAAFGSIVLRVFGLMEYSYAAAMAVALMSILYVITFAIIKRKY